jgi:hypothetical protein
MTTPAKAVWRVIFAAAVLVGTCSGWDTEPHRRISQAALDALPVSVTGRFGAALTPFVQTYCIYPDNYVEMVQYGFKRRGGPATAEEIKPYCVRPDGTPVHGMTGDRRSDTASLKFLLEGLAGSLRRGQPDEAARFAGVLSHFIADSLSPPHAVSAERLQSIAGRFFEMGNLNVHSAIERSVPHIQIERRPAPGAIHTISELADAVLRDCSTGAAENRKDLLPMVQAAANRDERTLDIYRLRAGSRAAEILADTLYALTGMAAR